MKVKDKTTYIQRKELEPFFFFCYALEEQKVSRQQFSSSEERMALDVEEWKSAFQTLMQEKKPCVSWTLEFDGNLLPDCLAPGWKQYKQSTFGMFKCSSCRRRWDSAKVQVLCHMYLENRRSHGCVRMRFFKQKCKKCSSSQLENPTFSPENTMRILENLVCRILEKYYGSTHRRFPEMSIVPEVPLEGPHDIANCEACALGYCVQIPSRSPPTHLEIGDHTSEVSRPRYAASGTQVPRGHPQLNREARQQLITGTDPQVPGVRGSQVKRLPFSDSPGTRGQERRQELSNILSSRPPVSGEADNPSGLGWLAVFGVVAVAAFIIFPLL